MNAFLRTWLTGLLVGLLPAMFAASAAFAAEPAPIASYSTKGKFEDVRDDLKAAIENRGLVIDYHSFINRMLERTGKDVGSPNAIYVDAQSFVFCSASLSRKTMEADPTNVAMCPYSISVYATVSDPERVVVAYRRPSRAGASSSSRLALQEVERLLDSIAREAVGIK